MEGAINFSNSISKFPQIMKIAPFRFIEKSPQPNIIANSSFTTFQSMKKKHITLKKPQSSKEHTNTKPSLLATIFNSLDEFICTYIDDSPLHPSIDPNHVLGGHFSPVDELPPTACEVEGTLPPCLEGAYIRNGPNPQFIPLRPYHLFDGDGMLHLVKISQGNKATLCSRFVKTYKYLKEREMGYPFFPSIFASFNGIGATVARSVLSAAHVLARQFDPITNGFGAANTNVALFQGTLFALAESDLPYAIKVTSDGDIVTLGRQNFQSTEPFYLMTAHPKIDHCTGEAFAYRYNTMHPFLTFFRIDSEGRKQHDVHINSLMKSTLIHDFAVTKNYAVFPDLQIVMNPFDILRGRSPVGIDATKVARLGIIPRYAEDDGEMWWVDTPGFNLFHTFNAWEENGGDTIVLVASYPSLVENALGSLDKAILTLDKIVIDVKAKTMQRHALSNLVLEFAVINPAYAAKKNRYVYAAVLGHPNRVTGVVKLDLSLSVANNVVASHAYGPSCCGGEPFFVAMEPDNLEADEDDGYLVTFVHDGDTEESKFLVMDAKSPNLQIVATVKLPQRVPLGFHGIFVPEEQLKSL